MLIDFLLNKKECKHTHVPIDVDEAYCPDCGALVKNKWYLVRCACCNIKRPAHFEYAKFKPNTKFCPNCGSTEFYVEELDSINCSNMNYVLFQKTVIPQGSYSIRQIWVEKAEEDTEKKLIEMKE